MTGCARGLGSTGCEMRCSNGLRTGRNPVDSGCVQLLTIERYGGGDDGSGSEGVTMLISLYMEGVEQLLLPFAIGRCPEGTLGARGRHRRVNATPEFASAIPGKDP